MSSTYSPYRSYTAISGELTLPHEYRLDSLKNLASSQDEVKGYLTRKSRNYVSGSRRDSILQGYSATKRGTTNVVIFTG